MKQVHLTAHNHWARIISERQQFIVAKDLDGVMCYVLKDGQEQTKEKAQ